ncbi:MAG TPA: hypothetical protein VMX15_03040, partial [Candidatus Heimdallarchaeota archaeon]|nr:hypothetical protein [Candidatus Heimdallarchaeota archaeon]
MGIPRRRPQMRLQARVSADPQSSFSAIRPSKSLARADPGVQTDPRVGSHPELPQMMINVLGGED